MKTETKTTTTIEYRVLGVNADGTTNVLNRVPIVGAKAVSDFITQYQIQARNHYMKYYPAFRVLKRVKKVIVEEWH